MHNAEIDREFYEVADLLEIQDGKLDLPDDVLDELDITVCSIHSKFELSKKKQIERVLRAHFAKTIYCLISV